MSDTEFVVTIDLDRDYTQRVDFGQAGVPELSLDEPAPLGAGSGPNPVRLVAAGVGGCLSASLLFCLRKARVDVFDLHTTVHTTLVRNERGRLRIGSMDVRLEPSVPAEQVDRVQRCQSVFEDYCVVTATLRAAFPIAAVVSARAPALAAQTV
jgi:uncharacterized OsmC-like protein